MNLYFLYIVYVDNISTTSAPTGRTNVEGTPEYYTWVFKEPGYSILWRVSELATPAKLEA